MSTLADLQPGEKLRLQDLQKLARDTSSHKDIPEAEMDIMVACLEEKRLLERKGVRSRPAAHAKDVLKTTRNIGQEVSLRHLPNLISVH
jgi:hypothetical protein